MELPAAERKSQDESCHCKSFHRKKADVILENFAKTVACFFFQHGFLLEGFDVFFGEILAFW